MTVLYEYNRVSRSGICGTSFADSGSLGLVYGYLPFDPAFICSDERIDRRLLEASRDLWDRWQSFRHVLSPFNARSNCRFDPCFRT